MPRRSPAVKSLRVGHGREFGCGRPDAHRGTAAWGLLQIVEVVRHAFNQAHGTHYARAQLLDPEVNVPIAAWLLRRIVDGYQRHHADVANLRTDWRNPRFVELVVFGWNAGMSEAAGVGRVVEYLKRRGIRAIDLDLVHEHAQAAGASRHLSNPAKVRWSRSVADLYAQERGFRNASWWAVKTPGVIKEEMNITHQDVSAIGRDIYAPRSASPSRPSYDKAGALQAPSAAARLASARTATRPPSGPRSMAGCSRAHRRGHPVEDATAARSSTRGASSSASGSASTPATRSGTARMWRGAYDQALDYRKRAKAWREQFQAMGGVPSAPEPHIPKEGGPLGDGIDLSSIAVGRRRGIVGAAIAAPPVIRALRKERAS
jgi:hypothetical protein